MPFVAGVDSSTQSTKVEVRDLDSGEVVGRGSAPHPTVTPPVAEQDPAEWWGAFESAWADAGSPAVGAISVGLVDRPVVVSETDEAVATGAAVQAAAVLEQVDHGVIQDRWGLGAGQDVSGVDGGHVRQRYAALRDACSGAAHGG